MTAGVEYGMILVNIAGRIGTAVRNRTRIVVSYVMVLLVALMMALNYMLFVFPYSFAPAGLNGIFTMIQYRLNFKFSYTTIIINIPLAIAAYYVNSKPRALRSITYCLAFSAFLMLFDGVDMSGLAYTSGVSALVGPLIGGLISGFGGYVMFKVNACYGGTEFVAGFIHKYKPGVNFFNVIFLLNISVALMSYFVYGYKIEPVLMCIIYCFGSSSVRDYLNRKQQSAVRCEIITDRPEEISQRIIYELHHSATVLTGIGAYSGEEKTILLCIVNPAQVVELTKIVEQFPGSFVVMSSATKVMGNFKRLDSHGKLEKPLFDQGKVNK